MTKTTDAPDTAHSPTPTSRRTGRRPQAGTTPKTGATPKIHRTTGVVGILLKIVALGVIDALAVYAAFVLLLDGSWPVALAVVIVALAITVVYLRPGMLPAKYLVPGTVFLIMFQLVVVVYSGYIAFTNYGDGHVGDKDDAIAALIQKSFARTPDTPGLDMVVVDQAGQLSFLVTDAEGRAMLGGEDRPLTEVPDAEFDGGAAVGIPGYTTLDLSQKLDRQQEIAHLSVPLADDLDEGVLRTKDGTTAYVYTASMHYDEAEDAFTDSSTGTVYRDNGTGAFTSDAGKALLPGWKIDVGFDNFVRAFGEESIRGPLLQVIVWTFVFAGFTVLATFAVGVLLAILLDNPRLRFRRTFRVLVILPYAFPAFLSALIWSGLLNSQFGFVNQVLLGGAQVPWLTDPLLAKVSILIVNLWLGYPYMFLVATGALQSIPGEYVEAARVDGAGAWTVFRRVKLPLLMVTMAPLMVAAFAFNFNNFNVIYMLTEGGPQDISTDMNVGATDILITLVYKVAFGETSGRDYGLASAFSIIIFLLVAAMSIAGFRRTKALEDLH
ncbi:MAG: maltose ABC transporter permease [Microbacterium sp. 69-10]|uniref:ABC transporter permease subunit n=1 Tax=Microbacterium sp. 69-10 TaxID=1895783 RepID=UPI0009690FB5|nr:ABC transporter permease subunit [Microbacterium sp. 69-10]OJU42236.1 MAG: maltose ABC transporter permease [Microbacterium sp. 69-10]